MKRSPLKRYTPLRRTPFRRSFRGPVSGHVAAYAECRRRSRCQAQIPEVCTGRNEHAHHIRLRSQGGPTTSDNLLACCHACHTHIHANPAWANQQGFILRNGDVA